MTEQWLSIVEYARAYQLSDMTVRRRIKNGKLNAVLKDGKYFIPTNGEESASAQTVNGHAPVSARQTKNVSLPDGFTPNRLPNQMTVVKSHPTAQKTIQAQSVTHQNVPREFSGGSSQYIPKSLQEPIVKSETCVADTRALLAFCEASLKKLSDLERRQVEKFKSKLESLEAQLEHRNFEIRVLRQQTEDLQLLVKTLEKMLESKSA